MIFKVYIPIKTHLGTEQAQIHFKTENKESVSITNIFIYRANNEHEQIGFDDSNIHEFELFVLQNKDKWQKQSQQS